MLTANSVANFAEAAVQEYFRELGHEVIGFTASIVNGRRYVGVTTNDNKQFLVEINVEEAK